MPQLQIETFEDSSLKIWRFWMAPDPRPDGLDQDQEIGWFGAWCINREVKRVLYLYGRFLPKVEREERVKEARRAIYKQIYKLSNYSKLRLTPQRRAKRILDMIDEIECGGLLALRGLISRTTRIDPLPWLG